MADRRACHRVFKATRRGIYDNMRTAVDKVGQGKERQVNARFSVGDGALGFWKALDEAFPANRHQRCWQHKTLNVLDKLPKSVSPTRIGICAKSGFPRAARPPTPR